MSVTMETTTLAVFILALLFLPPMVYSKDTDLASEQDILNSSNEDILELLERNHDQLDSLIDEIESFLRGGNMELGQPLGAENIRVQFVNETLLNVTWSCPDFNRCPEVFKYRMKTSSNVTHVLTKCYAMKCYALISGTIIEEFWFQVNDTRLAGEEEVTPSERERFSLHKDFLRTEISELPVEQETELEKTYGESTTEANSMLEELPPLEVDMKAKEYEVRKRMRDSLDIMEDVSTPEGLAEIPPFVKPDQIFEGMEPMTPTGASTVIQTITQTQESIMENSTMEEDAAMNATSTHHVITRRENAAPVDDSAENGRTNTGRSDSVTTTLTKKENEVEAHIVESEAIAMNSTVRLHVKREVSKKWLTDHRSRVVLWVSLGITTSLAFFAVFGVFCFHFRSKRADKQPQLENIRAKYFKDPSINIDLNLP